MTERPFCQSCGMPMDVPGSEYGTERDGSRSRDYCSYCYRDGAFTTDWTMEEMIEFCVGPEVEACPGLTPEAARERMQRVFPQLKRWRNA